MCEQKTERVCKQVPITTCQLVPYAECRLYMEEVEYEETEVITEGQYVPWECTNFTKEEVHQKLVNMNI